MSVAQQMMQDEEEGTKSPAAPLDTKVENEDKQEETQEEIVETPPVSTLDMTGVDAMYLSHMKLLPVKGVKPKPVGKKIVPNEENLADKSDAPKPAAGHLIQLEKEKLRLQQLLSKLDSDSLDKAEAGEVAEVVLDKIVKTTKEKRAKKEKAWARSLSQSSVKSAEIEKMEIDESAVEDAMVPVKEEVEEIIEDTYEVEVDVTPDAAQEDADIKQEIVQREATNNDSNSSQNQTNPATSINQSNLILVQQQNKKAIQENIEIKENREEILMKDKINEQIKDEMKSSESSTMEAETFSKTIKSTSQNNTPIAIATVKSSVSTTTPSPLSSSSTSSSKSIHKIPYSVHHKQNEPHQRRMSSSGKKNLISPGTKHHQEYHRFVSERCLLELCLCFRSNVAYYLLNFTRLYENDNLQRNGLGSL